MMQGTRMLALASALAMSAALPGAAATVQTTELDTADLNGLTPMANPDAAAISGEVYENVTGSIGGLRLSPWDGSIHEATGVYTSVNAGASATYDFAGLQTGFSLIWGSPDSYNDLVVRLITGDTLVASFDGTAAQGPVQVGAALFEVGDVLFDRLVLSSGSNAFEFANLTATPVPLPAGGLLLLGALGGLAALRRKRG